MTVNHNALTGAALHEPKGAAAASSREVYVADGAGSGAWAQPARMGWWDYNDLTTVSTKIPLTSAATDYELTNDGAGAFTIDTYALPDFADIWDVATNRFDFSGLALGDVVTVRYDVSFITTSVNTAITMGAEFDIGGTPFTINSISGLDIKAAGTYQHTVTQDYYIGSTAVKNNPARIIAQADKTGVTVQVHGWFIRVTKRNG